MSKPSQATSKSFKTNDATIGSEKVETSLQTPGIVSVDKSAGVIPESRNDAATAKETIGTGLQNKMSVTFKDVSTTDTGLTQADSQLQQTSAVSAASAGVTTSDMAGIGTHQTSAVSATSAGTTPFTPGEEVQQTAAISPPSAGVSPALVDTGISPVSDYVHTDRGEPGLQQIQGIQQTSRASAGVEPGMTQVPVQGHSESPAVDKAVSSDKTEGAVEEEEVKQIVEPSSSGIKGSKEGIVEIHFHYF